jgi:hypothetical protein
MIPKSSSDRNQLLVRVGTAVWLVLGILLLVLTAQGLRTSQDSTARAAPSPVPAAAALPPVTRPPADSSAAPVKAYTPDHEFRTGEELVLVFIGASFCGAQHKPGFPATVERAKVALVEQARARGVQFRAHAVSLDWRPADALAFLEHFGAFDEISVGSNWLNDGAVRYIWRDLPSEPAVPQLLLIQRHVETDGTVRVRDERVVRRLLGTDQITRWVDGGAQI